MAKATRTTTTRRAILITAPAALAAVALPAAAVAATQADPIFALIEEHRAAMAAFIAAVDTGSSAAADAIAEMLVATQPTTMAGVIALIDYAIAYVQSGETWPDSYHWLINTGAGDERAVTFETLLLDNIGDALKALGPAVTA